MSALPPRRLQGSARNPSAGTLPTRLPVLGGSASATTSLAAFHRALVAVGLGGYNLVRLSSVIPAGVQVGPGHPDQDVAPTGRPLDFVPGERGDRLYCVYAEAGTAVVGAEVWAGVGWAQRCDGAGGYFVEHHGGSADAVTTAIRSTLADMVADEGVDFEEPRWVVEGAVCEGTPVCALVVVPYVAVAW